MDKRNRAKKNSQLVIRINSEERDRFVALCDELDTSAAREVRRFIRRFLASHDQGSGNANDNV
ncbi:hypothetical protein GCM10011348_04540 [Marinobacterium nitratireducens]|uniref:Uncharacterized protein n=1 Tax=Marinobacterium nitratireducens TaxID=518897 RepID=A0A917Z972_9GAMM|nr:hypothetical protein [Marinobacterium nitratireducens]GGO76703.1 hypothetical protein GCM10011348_04540 [Marinobacterium nitratireducens]